MLGRKAHSISMDIYYRKAQMSIDKNEPTPEGSHVSSILGRKAHNISMDIHYRKAHNSSMDIYYRKAQMVQ
jgi:hypothetical protein